MSAHQVDYSRLFEVQDVPKIHGEPDYESITKLKDILKANASRITSELGGGGHGHLGLILSALEYGAVSHIPYIRPAHPGPLEIPHGTAQHAATALRLDHKKAILLYHETIDLDNALKKQVADCLENVWTDELRDVTTNTIVATIPQIFDHLYGAYGDITSELLKEREQSTRDMTYVLTEPLAKIYAEIDDLQKLGMAANLPFTPQQLTDIALTIIKKTGDFQEGLSEWFKLPRTSQTYVTLKRHFQAARSNLKKIRGPTMAAAGYGVANHLSQEVQSVRDDISQLQMAQTSVLEAINDSQGMLASVANHLSSTGGTPSVSTMGNPESVAYMNATMQNSEVTLMIRRLQEELAQVRANMGQTQLLQSIAPQTQTTAPLQPTFFTPQPGRGRRRRGPRGRQTRQQRDQGGQQTQQAQQTQTAPVTQQNSRRNQTGPFVPKYCWTHGVCGHCSRDCFLPAPNHQTAATLQNKMGGNTYDYSQP